MINNEEKTTQDKIVWRADLQSTCDVKSNTVRVWIKEGRLPPFDIILTTHKTGWKLSTLKAAKIDLSGLI